MDWSLLKGFMCRISSIIAIFLCGVWGVSQAKADVCSSVSGNIVQNCGFESGTFAGWTISGNTSGGLGNSYGVDNSNPNSGNYGAYFGAENLPITLSQTVSALAGENYQLTFYLNQESSDTTGGYVHSFDVSFDGHLLESATNFPYTNGYEKLTFMVSTAYGNNNSNLLKFDFQNDDLYFDLDDVSLQAIGPAVPEPATFLLVLPALAGVAFARRKRTVA